MGGVSHSTWFRYLGYRWVIQQEDHSLLRKQTLPYESAAVFMAGLKQTIYVAMYARFALGLKDTKPFYTDHQGSKMPIAPIKEHRTVLER